jgi:hypothetical protein
LQQECNHPKTLRANELETARL